MKTILFLSKFVVSAHVKLIDAIHKLELRHVCRSPTFSRNACVSTTKTLFTMLLLAVIQPITHKIMLYYCKVFINEERFVFALKCFI